MRIPFYENAMFWYNRKKNLGFSTPYVYAVHYKVVKAPYVFFQRISITYNILKGW